MNELTRRDQELFARFGLSPAQVDSDAKAVESETLDDELTGKVYYGLHLRPREEEVATISLRLPKSDLERITAHAKQYHISRSEYIRRQLAQA